MPGKPRFYNNRRPLNPRHDIIAVIAPNRGQVAVLQVNYIGANTLAWDFDADVLDVSDASDLLIISAGGGNGLPDSIYSDPPQSPTAAVLSTDDMPSGTSRVICTYAGDPDPTAFIWAAQDAAGNNIKFVGRQLNHQQANIISTP